jgi:hypothetical protein
MSIPRITLDAINESIRSVHYFTALQGARMSAIDFINDASEFEGAPVKIPAHDPNLGLLTFCVIVLKNGFTVFGHSACAHPSLFNEVIGREEALKKAKNEIWPLLGFQLKEHLWQSAALAPAAYAEGQIK